jgi:hypothetical protein
MATPTATNKAPRKGRNTTNNTSSKKESTVETNNTSSKGESTVEKNTGDRTIELIEKNSYGRRLFYPANETARLICKLLGTDGMATLPDKHIPTLKALGYKLIAKPEYIEKEL